MADDVPNRSGETAAERIVTLSVALPEWSRPAKRADDLGDVVAAVTDAI